MHACLYAKGRIQKLKKKGYELDKHKDNNSNTHTDNTHHRGKMSVNDTGGEDDKDQRVTPISLLKILSLWHHEYRRLTIPYRPHLKR